MSVRFRVGARYSRHRLAPVAWPLSLTLIAFATACERPTEVDPVDGPAFAPGPPVAVTQIDCSKPPSVIGGNKSVQVTVKLSTGAPGAGVVVTVVEPDKGTQCYGAASSDGIIKFNKVASGAKILLSLRDEVGPKVPGYEITPPPLTNINDFFDAPSLAGNRQAPALLSSAACTTKSEWTWQNWLTKRLDPCVVPGPGMALSVQLNGNAPTTVATLKGPSNQPLQNVVVAALSPWTSGGGTQATACAAVPWVNQTSCSDPDLSSGPALVESAGLTGPDGKVELGYAPTAFPVVLEAIAQTGGQTYFATIASAAGFSNVQMAPGMCAIQIVHDEVDASVPDVDIKYTEHSVGMTWGPNAEPLPINGTLIVRGEFHATNAGGPGSFTLQYQLSGEGGVRTVRADFTIPPNGGECNPATFGGSGNGLGDGVAFTGYCAKSANQNNVPGGRTAYTVYFILTNVDDQRLLDAWYEVKTIRDGVDTSKADFHRGSILFDTLHRTTCPVSQNNDGRYDSFRIHNNDGRYDSF